jgi:hypothetical protein
MDLSIILALVSAAAGLTLIVGRKSYGERMKLLLGGIAVAAGIVALALIAEGL